MKYLGKKGSVSGLMRLMKDLPNEEKPAFGIEKVNEFVKQFKINKMKDNRC